MGHRGVLAVLLAAVALAVGSTASVVGQGPSVLLVGPAGTPGAQFTSIQAAVTAAHAGDWVLVAPGVYRERGSNGPTDSQVAGVLITTPGIHVRGMDRGTVIVDGSGPAGTAAAGSPACSSSAADQDQGPIIGGQHVGRNGVEAYKTSGVYIENMTVCNFQSLHGAHTGNEVWWNAGDSSGLQKPLTAWGSYLTATSTFYGDGSGGSPTPEYGIFTSNIAPDPSYGPSLIDWTYSNNMADSSYYIGACPDCDIVLRHAHAQNSALGYSGTNGSGRLIIELGEWDHLRAGIVPNTLNNDDAPSPQTGVCPAGDVSPDTGAGGLCFVIRGNNVHDNNNPNTPGAGIAGAAPVGAGIELSGTQGDAVIDNTVTGNGSWGIVAHDFPDTETFPLSNASQDCRGGLGTSGACFYPSGLNYIANNVLSGNGTNGNLTNGDLLNEQLATDLVSPGKNCWTGNTDGGSAASEFPPLLQSVSCAAGGPPETGVGAAELLCASGIVGATTGLPISCNGIPLFSYPAPNVSAAGCAAAAPGSNPVGQACIIPLSQTQAVAAAQPKMDPCVGPPANAYCPASAALPAAGGSMPNTAVAEFSVWPLGIPALIAAAALTASLRRRGRDNQRRRDDVT